MSREEHLLPLRPVSTQSEIFPLDEFYAEAGRTLLSFQSVAGSDVPEPYRGLLVHDRDMTPTLQAFYHDSIHIEVIRSGRDGDRYHREVLLRLNQNDKVIEFGAIRINLGVLPEPARQLILQESLPLGGILTSCGVAHTSRPKAYLRVETDAFINGLFRLNGREVLYGRRNALTDLQQRVIAEIVEILPPA